MLTLECLPGRFTVCRLDDPAQADLRTPFSFLSVTDGEVSLVCPQEAVPAGVTVREDGFAALRVAGVLDFSLIGILAGLSAVLAQAGIGIFAVSTYNTDYLLLRDEQLPAALEALRAAGYGIC